jgi:hypothetical protein
VLLQVGEFTWQPPEKPGDYWVTSSVGQDCANGGCCCCSGRRRRRQRCCTRFPGTCEWGCTPTQANPLLCSLTVATSLAGWAVQLLTASRLHPLSAHFPAPACCFFCRHEGTNPGHDSKHASRDQQRQARRGGSAAGGGRRDGSCSAVAGVVIDCRSPRSALSALVFTCCLFHSH